MKIRRHIKTQFNATRMIVVGFFMIILIGALLLMLPFATASGESTDFLTALFTATTSICVTGLVVVPTYVYWSLFGKIVILILIQLGGLGVICVTVGFFMIIGKRFSLKERKLVQESYNLDSAKGVIKTVRTIFIGTFLFEVIGAILFSIKFVPIYGPLKGIAYGIFHSVSAFCNAGIDLIGDTSMMPYASSLIVNLTTVGLIVCGGIGFIVWMDFARIIKEIRLKEIPKNKFFERMTLHSKIALITTVILIAGSWLVIMIFEFTNPDTIGEMTNGNKALAALFEAVTLRTAGFFTVPQTGFRDATFIVLCMMMFIGGSPMGTAGGIKTTTTALVVLSVMSTIRGKKDVEAYRRKINIENVKSALAIIAIAATVLITGIMILTMTENGSFREIVFEAFSAMGTVGLSMDFTYKLSSIGRVIIIILMFFGRVGPITIAMAFVKKNRQSKNGGELSEKRVLVG